MLRWGTHSFTMTEINDVYADVVYINEVSFRGDGLTTGERLTLVDGGDNVVAEHIVAAATEDVTLISVPLSIRGLRVSAIPNGSVLIIVRIK